MKTPNAPCVTTENSAAGSPCWKTVSPARNSAFRAIAGASLASALRRRPANRSTRIRMSISCVSVSEPLPDVTWEKSSAKSENMRSVSDGR